MNRPLKTLATPDLRHHIVSDENKKPWRESLVSFLYVVANVMSFLRSKFCTKCACGVDDDNVEVGGGVEMNAVANGDVVKM